MRIENNTSDGDDIKVIELINGRWLVNNKKFDQCSTAEKKFLNEFFKSLKRKFLVLT